MPLSVMFLSPAPNSLEDLSIQENTEIFLAQRQDRLCQATDQLFYKIFLFQWLLGIIFALVVTPRTWIGTTHIIHIHVWSAIFLGLLIIIPPCYLIKTKPGKAITRHVIAIAQAFTGILLIHLSGGRIETHFHIFGSLAFLAMYRDWRVLITMTIVVAADHFFRGLFWPQSIYGVISGSEWRWLEHSAWVLFEDIFLIQSCRQSQEGMRSSARHEAQLVEVNKNLDDKVAQRTEQLIRLQGELVQTDKLASLGQLAAGIAHEINNPIGFIMSNLNSLNKYVGTLKMLLGNYQTFAATMAVKENQDNYESALQAIQQQEEKEHLSFLLEDIDNLLVESREGTIRVRDIVQGLKNFARLDESQMQDCDINIGLQDTIKIAWNDLKYKCALNLDLGEIPVIHCNPGQLNQVFLNLIINAADAMQDEGNLSITTRACESHVIVTIQDTGSGIPPEVLSRIFDPFFTTKPVGEGTGLGLSISYGIISKHQGTIEVASTVGQGTTFTIKLPIHLTASNPEQTMGYENSVLKGDYSA
jgi:signal transduction histidine kinase